MLSGVSVNVAYGVSFCVHDLISDNTCLRLSLSLSFSLALRAQHNSNLHSSSVFLLPPFPQHDGQDRDPWPKLPPHPIKIHAGVLRPPVPRRLMHLRRRGQRVRRRGVPRGNGAQRCAGRGPVTGQVTGPDTTDTAVIGV